MHNRKEILNPMGFFQEIGLSFNYMKNKAANQSEIHIKAAVISLLQCFFFNKKREIDLKVFSWFA